MYLSIALRLHVNVEAFNAVETVGNVTKHRRAPLIVSTGGGYELVFVPAVSGEAIANAFQRNLVKATKLVYDAEGLKPPLTPWDERYEFVKFMDGNHLTQALASIVKGSGSIVERKHKFEVQAIKESIVADVAGFLYAEEELPVKRTSRVFTGYMLPVYDAIKAMAIEAQFHARHVPSETGAGGQRAAQMIYYVEVASAIYGLTIGLDIDGIGKTSLVKVEDVVDPKERFRRVKASLMALAGLFIGEGFGAKLSRFTPVKTVESAVATISHPITFTPSPPQKPDYIEDTVARARETTEVLKRLGVKDVSIDVVALTAKEVRGATKVSTIEELFKVVIDKVLARLSS